MRDSRIDALEAILVRYSTQVQKGDVCVVQASTAAEPLVLSVYEEFFYAACLADDSEPVTAWQRQSDQVRHLADWIQGKEEVHVQGPGTDIKLNVSDRTWIPCVGERNMPDGEFFTGPVEDSVEG